MNKQRLKRIEQLLKHLEEAQSNLSILSNDLSEIKDEEQEYYRNMPMSLQNGEQGFRSDAALGYLEDAVTAVEDAYSELQNASENLTHIE